MVTHNPIRKATAALLPEIVALRHELHQHPEIRFEEHWTSDRIAQFLEENDIPFTRGHAGGTGIVADIEGEKPSEQKIVALRADMDALEIQEETGLPYASRTPGRMHACGHDGHIACLCGAAKTLSNNRHRMRGAARLIFQPAEEQAGGGRRIVEEGVLDGVSAAFALHAWPALPLGAAAVGEGPVMAGMDGFHIDIIGRGGHAADPANTVDPILVAAHIITALQSIVSRELSPWEPAVIAVTRADAGSAANVTPAQARLEGGFRALSPRVRDHIIEAIPRIAAQIAAGFRAQAHFTLHEDGYPPLCNDPAMASFARTVIADCFGKESLVTLQHPIMASEDFAFYLEKVPGAYVFLGNTDKENSNPFSLHHPRFDFNDAAIPLAVELLATLAIRYLGNNDVS